MSRGNRSFDVAGYVGRDRLWGKSRDILGDRFVIQIRGDRYLMMLDC